VTFSGPGGGAGRSRFSLISLMPVVDRATALSAAKAGAKFGFVIAATNAVVAVAAQLGFSVLPAPPGASPSDIALGATEIFGFFAVIDGILSWRVWTGRGYISATVLLISAAAELVIVLAVAHGGYTFFGFLVLKFLVDGVRGTSWHRKHRKEAVAEVFE
jgi:hypothetical protein